MGYNTGLQFPSGGAWLRASGTIQTRARRAGTSCRHRTHVRAGTDRLVAALGVWFAEQRLVCGVAVGHCAPHARGLALRRTASSAKCRDRPPRNKKSGVLRDVGRGMRCRRLAREARSGPAQVHGRGLAMATLSGL